MSRIQDATKTALDRWPGIKDRALIGGLVSLLEAHHQNEVWPSQALVPMMEAWAQARPHMEGDMVRVVYPDGSGHTAEFVDQRPGSWAVVAARTGELELVDFRNGETIESTTAPEDGLPGKGPLGVVG